MMPIIQTQKGKKALGRETSRPYFLFHPMSLLDIGLPVAFYRRSCFPLGLGYGPGIINSHPK